MDRTSMFYSQPSRVSSYPTYGRTQVKQRGGFFINPFAMLLTPMKAAVLGMAKLNGNYKQYLNSGKPLLSATIAAGKKDRTN